ALLTALSIAGPASLAAASSRPHSLPARQVAAASASPVVGMRAGTLRRPGTARRVEPTSAADHPAADGLPTVSGGFGKTPSISFPSSSPPTTLVSRVLDRGDGPDVRKGDLIAVNYTGQIWKGKVFDSTFLAKFDHQTPFATEIGAGQVVAGWDDGIPGTRVGSRLLLVLPPKWGYGKSGAPKAGISGSDTLVFVIDVLGTWGKDATAGVGARQVTDHHDGITVTGALGAQPQIRVASSAPQPKTEVQTLLERGDGPAVTDGLLVYEETVTSWSGKVLDSTWQQTCPTDASFDSASKPSNPLAGVPLGSRVLIETPKSSSQGGPYVFVLDLVADLAIP
ncbi:MAG TPA: FKBP-type peptidyl-prolyl cis-trans isomerase, partial [Acidimicrobiales bacterium]|nr:FKBP-type peptidyl-prolyl cis-trans isomerase [Acidimicrobiales bacterium]